VSNYSILVVDDEVDNFEVIEALLANTDHTLQYASHGQQAIDSLDKFDPDLILLDVMMPGIDGIEVCQQIKAMPKWQAVPIIMVTALTSSSDLARCLAAGADDFLSKPMNVVELRARVQSMLRIKKQHDRIESLSKLQRNSINSLKSNLNELNMDLASSFSRESDAPLNNILSKVDLLQKSLNDMTTSEITEVIESVNRSAVELDKFNKKFLFSRQLSSAATESNRQETCLAKISIEQLATKQIDQLRSSMKLIFDVEDVELAVTPKHLQYIVHELLDHILKIPESKSFISIYGYVMNEEFHCYIDNLDVGADGILNKKSSVSAQFNPASNSEQELSIGLKIAKKIVEIHDGLFLIANADKTSTKIYITLPLKRSFFSPKPLAKVAIISNESMESISNELQENLYMG
jgi:two-component system, sensor histidine kinase and response regulator